MADSDDVSGLPAYDRGAPALASAFVNIRLPAALDVSTTNVDTNKIDLATAKFIIAAKYAIAIGKRACKCFVRLEAAAEERLAVSTIL
jgi:hypothetical protein